MKFSHFFIDRPIFASVISIFIVLVGLAAFVNLPVTQYPEIAPPTVSISTKYSGASPDIVMNTVCAPLEQEINGVENMLYMQSSCASDGSLSIDVVFETGTDPDLAHIMVQNRVSKSESRLPKEVRDVGLTVRKRTPDILVYINLFSPNGTRDKLYLSNYAITQMQDRLSRVQGISEFNIFGAKEYCMRIWLDPNRLSAVDISPVQVITALQEQNKQLAAGKLNQPPLQSGAAFEIAINAKGRLQTEEEFGNVVVKSTPDGRIITVKDIARVELGANTYGNETYLNGRDAVLMGAYQLPGSNAVDTMKHLKRELEEMKLTFPDDVDYLIGIDLTAFISESIKEVWVTIFIAIALVVVVIMVFLQNWRSALIPLFAIPVSLIGTFAAMYAFGFSLNNLSLFGLVLAIGIVVDDAIVVVENVERNMTQFKLPPKEATKNAMSQVQGALIAIVLVLSSVFIPTALLSGILGQFYRQFALTIATSTIISGLVSLTLTPALCATFLKSHDDEHDLFTKFWNFTFGRIFKLFNKAFDCISHLYGNFVKALTKVYIIILLLYVALIAVTIHFFTITPKGFIPKQDQGYFMVSIQLPDASSFERTDELSRNASKIIESIDGVKYCMVMGGRSMSGPSSSSSRLMVNLTEMSERYPKGNTLDVVMDKARARLTKEILGAKINLSTPTTVRGFGSGGGADWRLQMQDKAGLGQEYIEKYVHILVKEILTLNSISEAYTSYTAMTPQLYIDVDRQRAQKLNVSIASIFTTLQFNLGSIYVNDFNLLGRVYRVVAQAESRDRANLQNIYNLKVPNAFGKNVPLGSLIKIKRTVGPEFTMRYNLYPCATVQGNIRTGYSSGEVISQIEKIAAEILPTGMGIEWTDLAFQEKRAGNSSIYIFAACVVFVFLLLCALYESWSLPFSIILIVPLVLLFAVMGTYYSRLDINIMSQIGFVTLIGLACKNAILIVEFAKQREDSGEDTASAVSTSSRNRLRPILMTSFAFIFGVAPLVWGTGAGFELRKALGTSVFYGMIGITAFGCIFTPVFYYVISKLFRNKS